MSKEQGFVGDKELFESRLCRLMEYQIQQTQHQLEMYQAQYQRQIGELTSSITKLIQTLEINARIVDNDGNDDTRLKVEVNSPQKSVDAVPPLPQPDCIGTPRENEQEPGHQDIYGDNQSTFEEIEEEITIEEETDPCLLEPAMSNVELQPQQPRLSDFTGIPSVDSPTVQLNFTKRNFYLPGCLPLYNFSREGKWEKAKVLLTKQPELLKSVITTASDTALLVAAKNKQWTFVEEILKIMPPDALELKDNVYGNTVLHIAAREGNKNVAKAIVDKNRNVTQIRDKYQKVPLLTAALFVSPGQKDTIEYLCTVTENKDPSPFSGPDGASLICNILDAHYYDIASYLFQRYPDLVLQKTKNSRMWPLEVIAERPFAFRNENKLKLREHCIYSLIQIDTTTLGRYHDTMGDVENPSVQSQDVPTRDGGIITKFVSRFITDLAPHVPSMERIYKLKLMHEQAAALVKGLICHLRITKTKTEVSDFFKNSKVLQTAIQFGTNELVEECLSHFPDLAWVNMNSKRLIQIAIEERNEKILKLICKTSKEYKNQLVSNRDLSGNSILHYAAKLAPSPQLTSVSGAALQMQREMQWFKGVQNLVDERNRHVRNKDGKSAQYIFTQEHNELRKEGEQWMKDTSHSCMLIATLIATVVFAAAFTVPGGNLSNDDNNENKAGTPVFLYESSFMVFAVTDSLALFSSVTSILMFLAILTSRYAEEDFLTSLPKKLIIGLGTLFFSIATTMIAFGAALFIVLGSRFAWVPIPIALCAFVPVSLFARLQFPLFVEMVHSTYRPSIFRLD